MKPEDITNFWFSDEYRPRWFNSTEAFDREIHEQFQTYWEMARQGSLDHWYDSADGCLALVILLDQFPLNMFRGEALGFATEAASRRVAEHAIQLGFDQQMTLEQRTFLYLPYMHSESLQDQDRSVALFSRPGLERNVKWAKHHREIIKRFGRFPHRNAILGRENTPEERHYLASSEAFTG